MAKPPSIQHKAKMSPTTSRFFINDKRVSTAVITKNGDFLQVYPEKKVFTSEAEWRIFWEKDSTPKFHVETTPATAPKKTRAAKPSAAKSSPAKPTLAKKSEWSVQHDTNTFTFPAGEYYIGDLCYALPDDVYDRIFGELGGYEAGLYEKKNSTDLFFLGNTAFGDGCFYGSDENQFFVDAGIIGIMSKSLLKKPNKADATNLLASKPGDGGHFYKFDTPVTCRFKDGRFSFRSKYQYLMIDTTGDDDGY